MASRYWVGGAGTWDASNTTNWSTSSGGSGGASVPTASDDVFFDANSGTGTVSLPYIGTSVVSSGRCCRNLDVGNIPAGLVFSNTDTPYYSSGGTSAQGNAITLFGTSLIVSGRTYTVGFPHPPVIIAGTGTAFVQATATGGSFGYGFGLGLLANKNITFTGSNRVEIRSNPYIYSGSTIDTGTGGGIVNIGWYLQGGVFNGRSNWQPGFTTILYSGTCNVLATPISGVNISQYGGTFSTSSLSTLPFETFRVYGGAVNCQSITFQGTAPFGSTWNFSGSATLSGTSISVYRVASFRGGGKNYANVTIGGGTSSSFISGVVENARTTGGPLSIGQIANLTFGTANFCSMLLYLPNNLTVTGSMSLNNQTSPAIVTFIGVNPAGATYVACSSVSGANRVNFCNMAFSSSVSGSYVGDGGGNSNISFSPPKTLYISQATYRYLSGNIYATSSGGAPSPSNIPLAHDTIIFDSNSQSANSSFAFYQGVIGNFTCTSAPTGTTFQFYNASSSAFFGNLTINTPNVITINGTLPLWGNGTTPTTVNITGTSSSRKGGSPQFYSGNYTLNGPYIAASSIGCGNGSLTLQSGFTYEADQLATATGSIYEALRDQVFTLNMSGATLALGQYSSGSSLFDTNSYSFTSFTVTSNASSAIELWDGTSGTTKNVYFPNIPSTLPKVVFRGSNSGVTYRFSNNGGSFQFPEIEELANQRSTATPFTINGSLDGGYYLKVKKWSIDGVSGTNVNVTSRFQYTGVGEAIGEYLTVTNSTAIPSSTWYAVSSTDGGGNSGWTFGGPFSGNGLLFGSNF